MATPMTGRPPRRWNNPGIPAVGVRATMRRSRETALRQTEQAKTALPELRAADRNPLWIAVIEHRIAHPDATLRELAESMTPPMTKHAYAAQLRRALAAADIEDQPS